MRCHCCTVPIHMVSVDGGMLMNMAEVRNSYYEVFTYGMSRDSLVAYKDQVAMCRTCRDLGYELPALHNIKLTVSLDAYEGYKRAGRIF
jgi:hypothetical protein